MTSVENLRHRQNLTINVFYLRHVMRKNTQNISRGTEYCWKVSDVYSRTRVVTGDIDCLTEILSPLLRLRMSWIGINAKFPKHGAPHIP
jgi:hypothetical protein